MTDFQIAEAIRLCNRSLDSTTVEFAYNLEICDLLSANPQIAQYLMHHFKTVMEGQSVRKASLALSLIEMLIKNLGINFLRYINEDLCTAWEYLAQRKSTILYSLTRNLYKVTQSYGTDNTQSEQWQQVIMRSRGLMQEVAESLLLYEGEAIPFFSMYKRLRSRQLDFPPRVESNLALIRGGVQAEELPEPIPATRQSSFSGATPSASSTAPPPQLSDDVPLTASEVDDLRVAVEALEGENPLEQDAIVCRRLRPRLVTLIQNHADSMDDNVTEMDEAMLEAMTDLISRLDTAVEPFRPPPPQQPLSRIPENHVDIDYLLAMMLQQQEMEQSGAHPNNHDIFRQMGIRRPAQGQRPRNPGITRISQGRQLDRSSLFNEPMAHRNSVEDEYRRQRGVPPPRAMANDGLLISGTPVSPKDTMRMESIEGPAVPGGAFRHSPSGGINSSSMSQSNINPDMHDNLETSLLGGPSQVKKHGVWDKLRQLAVDATSKAQYRTIGDGGGRSNDYRSFNEEEGTQLVNTREGRPRRNSEDYLFGDGQDNEAEWELVRENDQTYWYNKRTLQSQWDPPRWALQKSGQARE